MCLVEVLYFICSFDFIHNIKFCFITDGFMLTCRDLGSKERIDFFDSCVSSLKDIDYREYEVSNINVNGSVCVLEIY